MVSVPVAHSGELEQAFVAIERDRPNAMIVSGDLILQEHMGRVIDFARRTQLPVMYQNPEQAKSGGLRAYGANFAELFRRGADYTDKILKGAKPSELPVEQPTKFELVINLKTAKALGLTSAVAAAAGGSGHRVSHARDAHPRSMKMASATSANGQP